MKSALPEQSEHDLQKNIVNYLRLNRIFCFSVPNSGKRSIGCSNYYKSEGLTSGISDLILLLPDGEAVFVEIKSRTGQQSKNQKIGVVKEAIRRGLSIERYIIDNGVSGTIDPSRRNLGGLLKKIKQGDVLIASEISRLGRSILMIMTILQTCMERGVKVYTHKDCYELGDNIQSKVLAFAFGLSAEIERNLISLRTKEALAKRKADGYKLGRQFGSINKLDRWAAFIGEGRYSLWGFLILLKLISFDLMKFNMRDLVDEINKKMAINRERVFENNRHVED